MKRRILPVLFLLGIWSTQEVPLSALTLSEYSDKANTLIQSQQWSALESLMRSGIREFPDREWMYATLNQSLRNQKKAEEALLQAREMVERFPNTDRSRATLGYALTAAAGDAYGKGDFESCLKLSTEARDLNDSDSSYVWQGNALRKLGRFEQAAEAQELGLRKYPSNPWLKPNLALTYADWGKELSEKGEHAKAQEKLKRGFELDPRQSYILLRLARSYRDSGDFESAIDYLRKGEKQFPDDQDVRNVMDYTLLLRFRDTQKTASQSEIASMIEDAFLRAKSRKNYKEAEYLIHLIGEGLNVTGNDQRMRSIFQDLEKKFSDPVELWDYYGQKLYTLYRRKGPVPAEVKEEALSYRRKAMKAYQSAHPGRRTYKDVALPLGNRFMVWAQFDSNYMTHTGFAQYCYDFSRVDEGGSYIKPGGEKLNADDYYMFGEPVYAMTDGVVTFVQSDRPDNNHGSYSFDGNSVSIQLEDGNFTFYTHFQQDSIVVKEGQKIKAGQLIGKAGNSGMSSEPHLHVCFYDQNWVSLPYRFKKVRIKDGEREFESNEPFKEGWIVIPK
ncbi:MAG: peptidoglycan DD-metalloendopeptidase family protein [Leptospiraceae bacterium]|nr:peptidoglycan DD-metalloendopeptidase family protein [Leptospiraceae bacterium]